MYVVVKGMVNLVCVIVVWFGGLFKRRGYRKDGDYLYWKGGREIWSNGLVIVKNMIVIFVCVCWGDIVNIKNVIRWYGFFLVFYDYKSNILCYFCFCSSIGIDYVKLFSIFWRYYVLFLWNKISFKYVISYFWMLVKLVIIFNRCSVDKKNFKYIVEKNICYCYCRCKVWEIVCCEFWLFGDVVGELEFKWFRFFFGFLKILCVVVFIMIFFF